MIRLPRLESERGDIGIGLHLILVFLAAVFAVGAPGYVALQLAKEDLQGPSAGGAFQATPTYLLAGPPTANPICVEEVQKQYYPELHWDPVIGWTDSQNPVPVYDPDVKNPNRRFDNAVREWRGALSVKVAELNRLWHERDCDKPPKSSEPNKPRESPAASRDAGSLVGTYTIEEFLEDPSCSGTTLTSFQVTRSAPGSMTVVVGGSEGSKSFNGTLSPDLLFETQPGPVYLRVQFTVAVRVRMTGTVTLNTGAFGTCTDQFSGSKQ